MTDLTDAWIDAAAEPIWDFSNPEYPIRDGAAWQECRDLARQALEAAAPLIVAATRRQVAEDIARAIEAARGDRCPECGGKAAFRRVDGAKVGRGCGAGHVWQHPDRPWLNYDPAAISRQHSTDPDERTEVTP